MSPRTNSSPKSPDHSKSSNPPALSVAILWHMHQPYYKNPKTGHYQMPWVRLHGLKDYYDMAAVLKEFPRMRLTFNLVPSLMEQIEDYAQNDACDDHLLLTARPAEKLNQAEKERILSTFFSCNFDSMIRPYPRFRQLFERRGEEAGKVKSKVRDFDAQDFLDLQVWSNLVWIDPIFREDPLISRLFKKGKDFTEEQKEQLITKQRELLGRILPKYKELQDKGQIEISFSPYFHPILPLLCNTDAARFALPHIQLPKIRFAHPEDAEAQVAEGARLYERVFGRKPRGMWPSEGSVSEQIIPLAARSGVKWIATDEEILFRSLGATQEGRMKFSPTDGHSLYRPYKIAVENQELSIVFRDHTLSDLIGFVYSTWDAEEAADDLVKRLHRIRETIPEKALPESLVSVILDGENCWEYYKNDGHDFLDALYRKLSEDELIRPTTVSGFLQQSGEPKPLSHLFPGSWINHNFRIWIGHPEDNLAWDLVKKTRDALVQFEKTAEKTSKMQELIKKAWKEIYVAEGSDWNWWYGDEHEGPGTEEFDRIFRSHLLYVYELIGREPPEELYHTIKSKFVSTYFLPPTGYLSPSIDGERTHYYEWQQAGSFDPLKAGGTMHRVSSPVSAIYFGSDKSKIYLRIDPAVSREQFVAEGFNFVLEIVEPSRYRLVFDDHQAALHQRINEKEWQLLSSELEFSYAKIIELALPINALNFKGHKEIWFRLIGEKQGREIGRWPATDLIKFDLPSEKGEPIFWVV